MVLFAITGELGSGKTLTLTFLSWKNWFYRRKKIFSNYHLFKIPYVHIKNVNQLDLMREGFFSGDELWNILDSRTSLKTKNRTTSNILLRSRKRDLNYTFTCQLLEQLDKRIRKVLDFSSYPLLNSGESVCKVIIFRSGFPSPANYMKTVYFKTSLIMDCFDTNEEVDMGEGDFDDMGNSIVEDSEIVFQDSKDGEPVKFATWEEADKFAERWWMSQSRILKGRI